jgi:hypothetical protein
VSEQKFTYEQRPVYKNPQVEAVKQTITDAFVAEGILFDPNNYEDHWHRIKMGWDIRSFASNPPDELRHQMTGGGPDGCDTRTPITDLVTALDNLTRALRTVTSAGCVEEGPDRLNLSDRFMRLLDDYGRDLFMFLRDAGEIRQMAVEALEIGVRAPSNRPRNLVYDEFVRHLAEIFRAKTNRSPLTPGGKASTEFASIILKAEVILPEELRGRDLQTVMGRVTAALKR